jgi:isoleucyl-tRNA synthetase
MATDGEYTVVLDTSLDEALKREGIARDAISLFNSVRKEQGFEVSDRVRVVWTCQDPAVAAALTEYAELVGREILAVGFGAGDVAAGGAELKLGDCELQYSIERAS